MKIEPATAAAAPAARMREVLVTVMAMLPGRCRAVRPAMSLTVGSGMVSAHHLVM